MHNKLRDSIQHTGKKLGSLTSRQVRRKSGGEKQHCTWLITGQLLLQFFEPADDRNFFF